MILDEYAHVNDTAFLLPPPMLFFLHHAIPGAVLARAPDTKVVIASGYSLNGPTKAAIDDFVKSPEYRTFYKVIRIREKGTP